MCRFTGPKQAPAMQWGLSIGDRERVMSEMAAWRGYVRRLGQLDACAVSDALDKLGLSGVVSGLPQQSGEGRVAGRAITIKLGLGERPPGSVKHLGCTA